MARVLEGCEMLDKTSKAERYRQRAQELRNIAEGIFDQEERKTLIEIAEEYEKFAHEAEAK